MDKKKIADGFAKFCGVLAWMRQRSQAGITILMYHKVLPERSVAAYPFRNLVVEAPAFDGQMRWLAKHFRVVPVREAIATFDRESGARNSESRPLACVTFDDGYLDNFQYAAPVLESHGIRATFFVTTGFVEGSDLWFDRAALAWLKEPASAVMRGIAACPGRQSEFAGVRSVGEWLAVLKGLPAAARTALVDGCDAIGPGSSEVFGAMTPKQVGELSARGHEIGAHSVTHPIMTGIEDGALRYELERSRSLVGDWTGTLPAGFCYPNGDYDDRVISAARAGGFEYGIGTRRGPVRAGSNRMALPRRAILASGNRDLEDASYEAEVVGWRDFLRQAIRAGSAGAGI